MADNNNLVRITAPQHHVAGKLKFEGVRNSDPAGVVSFVGLDIEHDTDDAAARRRQTSTTTEHSTSHTADTTTHTETTTTVTVLSETHPKGSHPAPRPQVILPKKVVATGEAVVRRHWTIELVDPQNLQYIIKVDGVPVGVRGDGLYAFYVDDMDDVTRWHLRAVGLPGADDTTKESPNTFQIGNASGPGIWVIPGKDGGQVLVTNQFA